MGWLILWSFLNFGIVDATIADAGYGVFETPVPTYFVEYGVVAEAGRFTFLCSMENMFYKDATSRIVGGFMPFHDTFTVEASFRFNETFTVVANHYCEHTVNVQDLAPETIKYDESESRVYLNMRIGP